MGRDETGWAGWDRMGETHKLSCCEFIHQSHVTTQHFREEGLELLQLLHRLLLALGVFLLVVEFCRPTKYWSSQEGPGKERKTKEAGTDHP